MQLDALVVDPRVLIQVVDAVGIEQAGTALDAMNLIAFVEQQFGEVRAVLASHAGDEGNFVFLAHGRLGLMAVAFETNRRNTKYWLILVCGGTA